MQEGADGTRWASFDCATLQCILATTHLLPYLFTLEFSSILELNHKVLKRVSQHYDVVKDWKSFARSLGTTESGIQEIDYATVLSGKFVNATRDLVTKAVLRCRHRRAPAWGGSDTTSAGRGCVTAGGSKVFSRLNHGLLQ